MSYSRNLLIVFLVLSSQYALAGPVCRDVFALGETGKLGISVEKAVQQKSVDALLEHWRTVSEGIERVPLAERTATLTKVMDIIRPAAATELGYRFGDVARLIYLEASTYLQMKEPLLVTPEVFRSLMVTYRDGNPMGRESAAELYSFWREGKIVALDGRSRVVSDKSFDAVMYSNTQYFYSAGKSEREVARRLVEVEEKTGARIAIVGVKPGIVRSAALLKIEGPTDAVARARVELSIK